MRERTLYLAIISIGMLLALSDPGLCEPKYGGTLIVGNEVDPVSLDPHIHGGEVDGLNNSLMTDGLLDYDKHCNLKPGLAESWEIQQNGKVYVFHLRRGVKFHNGRDFTAADVKWNFDRVLDQSSAVYASYLHNIDRLEIVDDYTVRFTLKTPKYVFLTELANGVFNTPIIARESVNADGNILHPIGTGPFAFVEWVPTSHLRLKRSEHYWRQGLPYLDGVLLKTVTDKQSRLNAIKSGAVDITFYLEAEQVKREMRKGREGITFSFFPAGYANMFSFNLSRKPFSDKRVRQAVAHSISRQDILIGVFGGFGDVIGRPISPSLAFHEPVKTLPQDYGKARALLAEAGYPNGFDTTITTSNSYPHLVRLAQIFQANMLPAGIRVRLDLGDWTTTMGKWMEGKFGITALGWLFTTDPHMIYNGTVTTGAPSQWIFGPDGYSNPEIDTLAKKASTTSDFEERKAIYTQMAEIIVDEAPWVFTVFEKNPIAWRSDVVRGYDPPLNVLYAYSGGGFQHVWLERR